MIPLRGLHSLSRGWTGFFLGIALAGIVAGCASGVRYTSSYPPPPEQFANHSAGELDGFFDLHWSLDRSEGKVAVSGIITASQVGGVVENATVEVVGLDAGGQVVSRALGVTYGGKFFRGQSRPFWIGLRPSGRETQFRARVWSFEWEGAGGMSARVR